MRHCKRNNTRPKCKTVRTCKTPKVVVFGMIAEPIEEVKLTYPGKRPKGLAWTQSI